MPAGCSIASCCARPNRLTLARLARPFFFFDARVQTEERGGREPRTQLHLSNSAYVRGRCGGTACEERLAVTATGRRASDSCVTRAIYTLDTLTRRIYTLRDAIGVSCKNVTRDIKRARLL